MPQLIQPSRFAAHAALVILFLSSVVSTAEVHRADVAPGVDPRSILCRCYDILRALRKSG
jgi:hypothetical protein